MLGKLSKGLESVGVKLPDKAKNVTEVADSLEKGGLSPDALAEGLKDLVENKTDADPPKKQEMTSKLDKMTEFIKSGALTPSTISTLVQIMSAIAAKDFEKAKTLAASLVTGDEAGKNLAVISEVLKMVKQ